MPPRPNRFQKAQPPPQPLRLRRRRPVRTTFTERTLGFLAASIFSLCYYVVPAYLLFAAYQVYYFPTDAKTLAVLLPVFASMLTKPQPTMWILRTYPFQCIPKYFDFQEVMECSQEEFNQVMSERPALVCFHPHGVFSMVALCAAIKWSQTWWSPYDSPTAVADSVISTPLIKHVIGILGITSATSKSLDKALQRQKSVILYPGGTSELFLTNHLEERIHLMDRKGFIKVALRNGCALIPGYLFGNTHTLRLVRWPILRWFSRRTGIALTYFYGRFLLPMPFDSPSMCVLAKPLLLPQIENPTAEQVDEWHRVYVREVQRIFDTYKCRVPGYENKQLVIE